MSACRFPRRRDLAIGALTAAVAAGTPRLAPAAPRDYAVEVRATVREAPLRIDFSWLADASAQQYYVFKKPAGDTLWSEPIAVLPGGATQFTDLNVQAGSAHEYSFHKSLGFVADTVAVAPNADLTFTITDSWGDGICCQHGLGAYRVTGNGHTYAEGGRFDSSEATRFTVRSAADPCSVLVVSILLDFYGQETSWQLAETRSGWIVAQGGPYSPPRFGHIFAGIDYPAMEDRGTVLLLVDEPGASPLASELARLEIDLVRDGYRVCRRDIPHATPVPEVKERVRSECSRDPSITHLFLFGNIAVPYSGEILSGHEDQQGAWPADGYYGDLDGVWTDATVRNRRGARRQNHNVPGDGKFDQSVFPSDIDLAMGRVDLSRLWAFAAGEVELLRRYLNKNHAFRSGTLDIPRRGLVHDNVGELGGTAYACNGWRNFTAMFGSEGVHAANWMPALNSEAYLCAHGCGPSSYTACGGVVSTQDFATGSFLAVFTMLMGSYFGDWDNDNNVLRSPLASSGNILSCCWAGHPNWHLHHMALGYSLGHSARLSQNNIATYGASDGARQVYTALMGDPTLKLHIVKPPGPLRLEPLHPGSVRLTWSPSRDAAIGYLAYRAAGIHGDFSQLQPAAISDTTCVDERPLFGCNVYMVRAVKRETTASGTYFNLSPGVIDSVVVAGCVDPAAFRPHLASAPNPFRSSTTIRFDVGCPTWAALRIYTPAGRLVRSLDLGAQRKGAGTLVWDGTDARGRTVASGLYLLEIDSPKGAVRRKIVRLE